MPNLKPKLQLLQRVNSWIAGHLLYVIIFFTVPVLVIGGMLLWQVRKTDEVVAQKPLSGKQARALENVVATSQQQLIVYKAQRDSLFEKAATHEDKAAFYQHTADSLKTQHDKRISSFATSSAAELQRFLTDYQDVPADTTR